jgi:hypothetical protein
MRDKVIKYLMEHYGISKARAASLVDENEPEINAAQRWASQPYYPAGIIAQQAGIPHFNPCVVCEAEELAQDDDEGNVGPGRYDR